MFEEIFRYKSANKKKLQDFGFEKKGENFVFETNILEDFCLQVCLNDSGEVFTKVFDNTSGDQYSLYLLADAKGEFVGQVKDAVKSVLQNVCDACFEDDVFKSKQTKEIIQFVEKTYGEKLEFLWEKFPNNAILRRTDNKKWYAVFIVLPKRKLGVDSDQTVDVIDLRCTPETLKLVDNDRIFPAYHMNKTHWLTICLDGRLGIETILTLIDKSRTLANKK